MAQPKANADLMSSGDYLAGENDGNVRHEFVNGRIFAMAGGSERHNIIKLNIAAAFNASVSERCRVFDGDMKLRVADGAETRFYYPDVFVSCEPGDPDGHVRSDAVLVIEVLSPSTARVDRLEKFAAYTTLPMLSEYALVDQSVPKVEVFRRRAAWQREVYGTDDAVDFESIGQTMTVEQIYRRVTP